MVGAQGPSCRIEQQAQQFGIPRQPLGAHQFDAALQVFNDAHDLDLQSVEP